MATELGDLAVSSRAARRAYELGRLRVSVTRAALLASVVALVAGTLVGRAAVPWSVLTLALWVLLGWRGGALLRGGRYGLVAGAATFLLPLSVLRPCCRPGVSMSMSASCCTMPGVCVLVGAALGLTLAWFVPRTAGRRLETAGGMVLGVSSVAALKCSGLFMGEALGLLGGLGLGVVAVNAAGAWLDRRRAAF